jgi:hypothetical protein
MIYMCSAKFELTGRYLETVKQDRFRNEKEAEDEEVDADGGDDYVDGISDTEEQDPVSDPSLGRLTSDESYEYPAWAGLGGQVWTVGGHPPILSAHGY